MWQMRSGNPGKQKQALSALLLIGVLIIGGTPIISHARDNRYETIEASAMGTGTQLGQVIEVTLIIYDYSTPEDKQILMQAFEKGRTRGW
jgi:hypothetical protein